MDNKKQVYYLILIILCFLVYINSLNNAFVSDDIAGILENPTLAHPLRFWKDPTNLLYSFNYLIAGYNPFIYHLTNIILHSINTLLVFFFLNLFFEVKTCFLSACLFATHPIHTEAVTWVSGRPYLILTLFILITYLLYYTATDSKKFNTTHYILCLILFSYFIINNFGFYSILPFLLILSDVTFGRWRKNYRFWLPFLAILIVRLILAKGAISERVFQLGTITGHKPTWTNPLFKLIVVFFSHFGLMLWPVKLTLYHDPIRVSTLTLNMGIISFLILAYSLPFIFKKAKEIFFGIAIFILFFAPVYSPVAVSGLVAERYIYFPSLTLSIFAAFFYEKYVNKPAKARVLKALSLFILIMVALAVRTIVRNEDWKTQEKFWQTTVDISYKSPMAHNESGLFYQQKGEVNKAITFFKKAIELDPNWINAYNNLGNIYSDVGKKEEAIALYKKVIEINPYDRDAYYNLGITYNDMGQTEEAIVYFKKAIEINPTDIYALNNLGIIYAFVGKRKEAIALFRKAIEIDPNYAPAYFNLSRVKKRALKNSE